MFVGNFLFLFTVQRIFINKEAGSHLLSAQHFVGRTKEKKQLVVNDLEKNRQSYVNAITGWGR